MDDDSGALLAWAGLVLILTMVFTLIVVAQ